MINPVEFVGGAGLGTAVSLLSAAIIYLIETNHMFSPLLKEIRSTVEHLAPLYVQMSQSNQLLSYAEKAELEGLHAVVEAGRVLVDKCETVHLWNCLRRIKYAERLRGWKEDFANQSKVVLMQQSRDTKKIAVGVQKVEVSTANTEVSTGKIVASVGNLTKEVEIIKSSVGNVMEELKNIKPTFFEAGSALPGLPQPPRHPVGLEIRLRDLKEQVFQDGVSMFVVTAFAGCGKTTLVSQFCRDEDVKDKFKNNIFFLTISENPKTELIVKQLYQQKGWKDPDFPNTQSAGRLLDTFLEEVGKNPLLVVLDDVWQGSESELLITKFDLKMSNYKVLVTSRSPLVGFGPKYDVQLLGHDHAMELFLHWASLRANEMSSTSKDLARQIVKYCLGNPQAIQLAGVSFRGREPIWKRIISEWSEDSSIFDHTTGLLHLLLCSIAELNQETRNCFLDLGSFPQKKHIPVATLFDMWAVLYDLKDDIVNRCDANLCVLSTWGLANLVQTTGEANMEVDGCYSKHFVIQPDLLRELAIYLSKKGKKEKDLIEIRGNKFPKRWSGPECLTFQCCLLSISTDRNFSMKWPPNIQLPKAKVLVLNFQTQESRDNVLPEFLRNMPELKVLVVNCDALFISWAALSSFHLLEKLSNLETIILEGVSIPSITNNPIQLACVRKISLFRCYKFSEAFSNSNSNSSVTISNAFPNLVEMNIDSCDLVQLPSHFTDLTSNSNSNSSVTISNAFPNLVEMNIDSCDLVQLPSHFTDLIHLKQLNITNCWYLAALPKRMGSVTLEVLRLRFCRALSMIPNSIELNHLTTLDLSDCSSLQKLPKYIGEMSSLKKLDVSNCGYMQELPQSLVGLQHLDEVKYSYKTKKLWDALSRSSSMPKVRMVCMKLQWSDFLN